MTSGSQHISAGKGLLALSPLAVFLLVYLVSSIAAGDFYAVPVSSAFLIASVYAVVIARRAWRAPEAPTIQNRIRTFSEGVADNKLLLMIWIFILAGAFAQTARDIGAVDATVSLALRVIPPRMLFAGLFLTACFISMAMGTSVGTIVSLAPIANGIALHCGVDCGYMAAIIVGGAFFGDNLSFISDTTIAATRAVDCEMSDKFKANIKIVLPAFVAVTVIYLIQGAGVSSESIGVSAEASLDWFRTVPYLAVILLAVFGTDVMVSLGAGIVMNAAIGFATGTFAAGPEAAVAAPAAASSCSAGVSAWTGWLSSLGKGIAGMSDLIIVTMLAGGLLGIIRAAGGLDFIIDRFSRKIRGPRGAQFSIAAIVSLANLCTANNTIAIITTGGVAKDIADRFGVDPRRTASILDTFSCLIQGLIPYGAQLLMVSGLVAVSPAAIIPHLYYPFLMGVCAILAILFTSSRRSACIK